MPFSLNNSKLDPLMSPTIHRASGASLTFGQLRSFTVTPWVSADAKPSITMPVRLAGDILVTAALEYLSIPGTPDFTGTWNSLVNRLWTRKATGDANDNVAFRDATAHPACIIVASFANPDNFSFNTFTGKSFYNGSLSDIVALPAANGAASPGAGNFHVLSASNLIQDGTSPTEPAIVRAYSNPYFGVGGAVVYDSALDRTNIAQLGYNVIADSNTATPEDILDDTTLTENYGRYGQACHVRWI